MKTTLTFGTTLVAMAATTVFALGQALWLAAAPAASEPARVVRHVELEPVVITSSRARAAEQSARQTAQASSESAAHYQ